MAFYTNQTRQNVIVTLQIQSTNDPPAAVAKGTKDAFQNVKADVGYHDLLVEAGLELRLGNNTTATLIGTRAEG